MNSSPDNQHYILEQKELSVRILTVVSLISEDERNKRMKIVTLKLLSSSWLVLIYSQTCLTAEFTCKYKRSSSDKAYIFPS